MITDNKQHRSVHLFVGLNPFVPYAFHHFFSINEKNYNSSKRNIAPLLQCFLLQEVKILLYSRPLFCGSQPSLEALALRLQPWTQAESLGRQ